MADDPGLTSFHFKKIIPLAVVSLTCIVGTVGIIGYNTRCPELTVTLSPEVHFSEIVRVIESLIGFVLVPIHALSFDPWLPHS